MTLPLHMSLYGQMLGATGKSHDGYAQLSFFPPWTERSFEGKRKEHRGTRRFSRCWMCAAQLSRRPAFSLIVPSPSPEIAKACCQFEVYYIGLEIYAPISLRVSIVHN